MVLCLVDRLDVESVDVKVVMTDALSVVSMVDLTVLLEWMLGYE